MKAFVVSQVIAFTCCVITVILMLGATSTADWMMAEGWREGLFVQCVSEGAHLPLPFGIEPEVGCSAARTSGNQTKLYPTKELQVTKPNSILPKDFRKSNQTPLLPSSWGLWADTPKV